MSIASRSGSASSGSGHGRSTFGSTPAGRRGRGPRGDPLAGRLQALKVLVDQPADRRRRADAERRVDLVVPLVQPRLQLDQARHHRHERVVAGPERVLVRQLPPQREGLVAVVPPRPAQHRRRVALAAHARVEHEPLLGDVELAPRPPELLAPEVLVVVLRRDVDLDLLPRVLAPLQRPHLLPGAVLLQPGGGVAVRGEVRHRLLGDQRAEHGRQVRLGVAGEDGGQLAQHGVGAQQVGQLGDRPHDRPLLVAPQLRLLQPVQDRGLERGGELVGPRRGRPAALELGLLQQADVRVGLDQVEPTLHERGVVGGPARRQLGDRGGAVAGEPGGLLLARLDLAGERDLERPLAERELVDARRRE